MSRLAAWVTDVGQRLTALPLRWQIGTLVLVGLVAVFTLFGLLGFAIAQDGKQRTLDDWLNIDRSTASFIDTQIAQRYARLEWTAVLVRDTSSDPVRQRQTLESGVGQADGFVGAAFLLDRNGSPIWSEGIDPTVLAEYVSSHREVLAPLSSRTRYASGVERIGGEAAFVLAVPVVGGDRQPTGVLGVVGRLEGGVIHDLVASARGIAHTGHAELVDRSDTVLASSESGRVLTRGEHPDFYEPLLLDRRSAVGLTAAVGHMDPEDEGQRHDMAFVPLQGVPWGLALGGSDAELSAYASRWQQQITVFGGLVLGLALLMVWLTTRSVARPIEALTMASRQIAAGDLSTPIPRGGEGEVRELAQAFDQMRHELQRALSALALEKSRYEGIVSSMADAVVTTDPLLRITAFNPSASALTGHSVDDVRGRLSCGVICSRNDAGACAMCPLLKPETELGVTKEVIHRRDGGDVNVAITRSAIRDQSGNIAGIVHVLRDISAEEQVNRLKDEFLSTVSHELRTPLGFIMGYATTLLLPDAPDDRAATRRCAQVIADASEELKELVDNLLDMTKIGAGSLSVSSNAVRLGPLARAAVERIRVRAQGHRFLTALPSSLPLVLADAHRVEQVLYNLLDNAIKYSPDGGRITVRAVARDDEVMMSVLDEGLGITAEELPTLFQRFHRGDVARSRGIGGTGLGLAICKGIVEAHGGRIWAESPPPEAHDRRQGTAIRFTLPISPTERLH